ncbi:MAG: zinc-ribbon domain-containing protein [Methanomassiliicoccales archaeon]
MMPSCAKCGKPLLEGMRFCPYCGQSLAAEEIEQFEPAKGEVVTAVAAPSHIVGREGTFALAMSTEKLIFARIREVELDRAKGELRQAGIFMPGSSSSDNVSRFYEMSPEQVMEETPGNFSVEASDVSAIHLSYDGDDGGKYVIRLRSDELELTFTLPYDKYYRDLLFRLFEGRITW